jgi:hypothetical protein
MPLEPEAPGNKLTGMDRIDRVNTESRIKTKIITA